MRTPFPTRDVRGWSSIAQRLRFSARSLGPSSLSQEQLARMGRQVASETRRLPGMLEWERCWRRSGCSKGRRSSSSSSSTKLRSTSGSGRYRTMSKSWSPAIDSYARSSKACKRPRRQRAGSTARHHEDGSLEATQRGQAPTDPRQLWPQRVLREVMGRSSTRLATYGQGLQNPRLLWGLGPSGSKKRRSLLKPFLISKVRGWWVIVRSSACALRISLSWYICCCRNSSCTRSIPSLPWSTT